MLRRCVDGEIDLTKRVLISVLAITIVVALVGCGAGSRTAEKTATKVACDFTNPPAATTINVLAYNSSAVDPFTNTMVSSCTHDNVTVKHDPIDFGGQVQKTTATLSSDTGSYDILETYSFVIPDFGSKEKLVALDDLFAKYSEEYKLGDLDPAMVKTMSYDGQDVRPAHAGPDPRHGLPQGSVRQERHHPADHLRGDEGGGQEAAGRRGHEVPARPALLATGDIGTAYRIGAELAGEVLRRPGHQEGRTSRHPRRARHSRR